MCNKPNGTLKIFFIKIPKIYFKTSLKNDIKIIINLSLRKKADLKININNLYNNFGINNNNNNNIKYNHYYNNTLIKLKNNKFNNIKVN